jgi:hypothetical protein
MSGSGCHNWFKIGSFSKKVVHTLEWHFSGKPRFGVYEVLQGSGVRFVIQTTFEYWTPLPLLKGSGF